MHEHINSKPYFSGFNPEVIKSQFQAFGILENWDYENKGVCELLLSGSLGSSKSMFMAYYAILHCLTYSGARTAICRRSMPALRKTIYLECIQMLEGDIQPIYQREYYHHKQTHRQLHLANSIRQTHDCSQFQMFQ